MIHVEWPWMLLALPLPWAVARWLPPAAPQGMALFMPFALAVAGSTQPGAPQRSRLRRALLAAIWLLLVAAAVRPQWLGDAQPVPSTGRRLLLAVDVSGSMATQDMADNASRLQVVKQVAGDFIRRRHGDQVGLILFGSRPYVQAPLSADLDTVDQFLQEAAVGVAGPATALGDAIGLALKRLQAEPDHPPGVGAGAGAGHQTVLVLLTDGSSNAGAMPPLQAAQLAAAAGLRIYTIGVGAAPEAGFFGFGAAAQSDLDEDTLKAIAQATGGSYFRATDAQALQQVYARIDGLEPAAGRDQWVRPRAEWFTWPLALALLLSLPAAARREPAWT
jgi:Ca-activated chloride channel family protein